MEKLNLHGIRHHEVERLVEDFVLTHDFPLEIVTGNSVVMQRIVREVCERYGLTCDFPNYYNLGSFVVRESDGEKDSKEKSGG